MKINDKTEISDIARAVAGKAFPKSKVQFTSFLSTSIDGVEFKFVGPHSRFYGRTRLGLQFGVRTEGYRLRTTIKRVMFSGPAHDDLDIKEAKAKFAEMRELAKKAARDEKERDAAREQREKDSDKIELRLAKELGIRREMLYPTGIDVKRPDQIELRFTVKADQVVAIVRAYQKATTS